MGNVKRILVALVILGLLILACGSGEATITPTPGPTSPPPTPPATHVPTITPTPGPTEEPTPTPIGVLEPLGHATVIVDNLNVRTGPLPFSEAPPIGLLHRGDEFDIWESQSYTQDTDQYRSQGECGCDVCNVWVSNSLTEAWWVAYCYGGNQFIDSGGTFYIPPGE